LAKPISRSKSNSFLLVGQNSSGRWVVRDSRGLCGGLFVNREEALRFALSECVRCPRGVIMVPGNLELDVGTTINIREFTDQDSRQNSVAA